MLLRLSKYKHMTNFMFILLCFQYIVNNHIILILVVQGLFAGFLKQLPKQLQMTITWEGKDPNFHYKVVHGAVNTYE